MQAHPRKHCSTVENYVSSKFVTLGLICCITCAFISGPTTSDKFATAAEPEKAKPVTVKSPLTPEESLKYLKITPGLKLEIAACEPAVIDPVAVAFDEDGRMWVVEMTDYPNGPTPGEPPKSRISLLEDRNGDGRYETAAVFADKLLFCTGVQPWKGGVIATLSGEVAYFKDTDGDGKADLRETWFRGFVEENPQLRANHPRFGLDNQVYISNGLRGGNVVADPKTWGKSTPPVPISNMDFRFDPLTGVHSAISGQGQFGLTFDDYGNRFVCTNRNPCHQIVLDDRYIKRNPFLAIRAVGWDVSPAAGDSKVFPLSNAWTTSTLHAGTFTAACGVTIYRGTALPAEYQGNSFTCEPTGNLVHRDILEPLGATFTSHYAGKDVEFIASPDTWFRPVNMAEGPDGALYVVDMYRAVIEHPQFVPEELKNRPDLRDGDTLGRIYRVAPASSTAKDRPKSPKLSKATSAELVTLLGHPNAWQRETAARLLYERQDKSIQPDLELFALKGERPQTRVQALWALAGLGVLTEKIVFAALSDSHPRVREQAVLLAERWLKTSPVLQQKLIALAMTSKDIRECFQLALSLGELSPSPEIVEPLGRIALFCASDEWTRKAVLTSLPEQTHLMLAQVLPGSDIVKKAFAPGELSIIGELSMIKEAAEVVGSRQEPEEIARVLVALNRLNVVNGGTPAQKQALLAGLTGIGQGLARRGGTLTAVVEKLPAEQASLNKFVERVFINAVGIAKDAKRPLPERQSAINALPFAGFAIAGDPLLELAQADESQEIRLRAIDVLGGYHDPRVGQLLIELFPMQTPAVRRSILQAMFRDVERTKLVLGEIAAKRIAVGELDPNRVRELTNHGNPEIKKQALELLAAAIPADRKQVLETYQKALTLNADALRGRQIFEKNCTTCHKIGTLGVDVAPDIADSRTKTPAGLLVDILSPNQAIDNNYVSYTVATRDGKTVTGIIAAETASSITLRQPENKTVIVLRQDIEELRSNGVSLMPEGLEKNISVEQMADLISFIKNWRYLDGQVPLGKN